MGVIKRDTRSLDHGSYWDTVGISGYRAPNLGFRV